MNILYCGDKNITDGLIISVLSLANHVKVHLNIYVLTMSYESEYRKCEPVDGEVVKRLEGYIKQKNERNSITVIDGSKLFAAEPPVANMGTRFTPCCMLRLYADQVPELPDKLLYLDTDVVCRQDFYEFYYQDMRNLEVVGVLDNYGKWFFRRNIFKMDYLNSGVLLMNLKRIRETEFFGKCRERCRDKKMFMPDQSAINKLAVGKKAVPRCYNEQQKLRPNTVFQHFTTRLFVLPWPHTLSVKPWHVDKMHSVLNLYEYDDILDEYINVKPQIIYDEV